MNPTSPSRQSSPMPTAQLEARACQRARDEHVHIFAVPGRPGMYTTKSKSDPTERYTLVNRDGAQVCSCKGFAYRQSCKHVEALRNRLARETTKATPEPVLTAPAIVKASACNCDALFYANTPCSCGAAA